MKRIILLIALLPLFVAAQCPAATYYVATTGSNSHTSEQARNPETPWLTLNHAESSAADGDVVHVAAGTYVENVGGAWSTSKAIAWNANGQVIVRGASARPLETNGPNATSFTGFIFDAQNQNYCTVLYGTSANKSFISCTFKDARLYLIHSVVGAGLHTFQNCAFKFENYTGQWALSYAGSGLEVIGCNFNFEQQWRGILKATQSGVTGSIFFSGNTCTATIASDLSAPSIDIESGTYSVTISGNSFDFSVTPSMYSPVILIKDQMAPIFSNNVVETWQRTTCDHLNIISTGTECGSPRVSDNVFKSRSETGHIIFIGAESTGLYNNKLNGLIFSNNTIYGILYYDSSKITSTTHALLYGFNINGLIINNRFIGCPYGTILKHNGSMYTDGGIFYNYFLDCSVYASIYSKGVKNVMVYNNLIYNMASWPGSYYGIEIDRNASEQSASGCILKNNIVVGNGDSLIYVGQDSQEDFVSDYNCLIRHSGPNLCNIGGTFKSWSEWQANGYDQHGLNADPQFLDPANGDFRLNRSSPAINAGTDVGLTSDIRGWPVPMHGIPDIGAYEYWEQSPIIAQ